MKPGELIESLKKVFAVESDSAIARMIGLTPARISQWRSRRKSLSPRQVASLVKRTSELSVNSKLRDSIRPIVELYPLDPVESKQDARWEILPTDKRKNRKECKLREYLQNAKGIYFFYNSEGQVIYVGQTQKRSLWKRMNETFNREARSHQAFLVRHPSTGAEFQPAWEKLRQPQKRVVYLYDVATFFSAYEINTQLIDNLEAMIVRAFCNNLANVKMEKFDFKL